MDDAREWTATAPRGPADAPVPIQPGDPWGAPLSASEPRDRPRYEVSPDAVPGAPAGVWRRAAALAVDLALVVILVRVGLWLAAGLAALAPGVHLVAHALGVTWLCVRAGRVLRPGSRHGRADRGQAPGGRAGDRRGWRADRVRPCPRAVRGDGAGGAAARDRPDHGRGACGPSRAPRLPGRDASGARPVSRRGIPETAGDGRGPARGRPSRRARRARGARDARRDARLDAPEGRRPAPRQGRPAARRDARRRRGRGGGGPRGARAAAGGGARGLREYVLSTGVDDWGLACGGTMVVFVEPLDASALEWLRPVIEATEGREPVAVVTAVDGPAAGARLLVREGGVTGSVSDPALTAAATDLGRRALAREAAELSGDRRHAALRRALRPSAGAGRRRGRPRGKGAGGSRAVPRRRR